MCVDASVAVKWVIEEPHTDRADALYAAASLSGDVLIAPLLLRFEVTNIVRKRMRREGLSLSDAERMLLTFLDFAVDLRDPPGLHRQALRLADGFGLAATYDAHYVALAQTHACDLWTDDQRLLRMLGDRLPFVRWIGDYSTAT